MFMNAATDFVAVMKDAISENKTPQRVMLRETHPRMPWHDLHSAVSGAAARDVASHFIQVRLCLVCVLCVLCVCDVRYVMHTIHSTTLHV